MTYRIVNVGCVTGGEAFLIITEGRTAVIDSGFSFTAKGTVSRMKAELAGRPLDYIILTHSHYDHISGASLMKRTWPDAKILSAEHAAKVFEKKSAMKAIRRMNRGAASYFKKSQFFRNDLSRIHTDVVVRDGDIIDLGPMKLQVMDACGHTRDSLGFWCESERLAITCETMGVLCGGDRIMPACLVSYESTMDYIDRVERLHPRTILHPHYGLIEGEEECSTVISWAKRDNREARDTIVDAHRKGMDVEAIKQLVKDTYYTEAVRSGQPETAFDLNNRYMVPMIIKECGDS